MDWTILMTLAAIYVALCLGVYFFQHWAFFRPEVLPPSFQYKYPFPFQELNFDREDGGRINAIHFEVPNSRGLIYYLKGNSRSIKGWGKFAKDFLANGYDFFMMDYRGFGKSKGKRNQQKLFDDAQFIYDWLKKKYPEKHIVVFGRSLGTGIAARIASWNQPKMLILDSPYFSFRHNVRRFLFFLPLRWLLRYDMRTDEYLREVRCPVHIVHGTRDRLIPFAQSQKLKDLFPELIELHPIAGAGHNNLPQFAPFFETLYDILYVPPKAT